MENQPFDQLFVDYFPGETIGFPDFWVCLPHQEKKHGGKVIPELKTAKILIRRDEATALPQLYYSKLPDGIEKLQVLLCDPMLGTGGSALTAIEVLKKAGVKEENILFINVAVYQRWSFQSIVDFFLPNFPQVFVKIMCLKGIATNQVVSCPEGLKALAMNAPDVRILTCALDSHLNEVKFIVPGVGDFGDRYYGTTGYAEGLWGTNGRWHFPGWAFGPRGASMRQPRPCDVKREEKRQYIDAKKKAKKRQSRNHVAGVEPTQWPHCNGTWIDRYIISKLMVSDIPSYPIQTNPMNVHKNYHHGNHSHDPAGHPLGPSIRQEQRHLESLWPVGDPGGFHGEIWCRMVSDSMGTSEMGRNGYHKYWFNRDSMGYLYIYIYLYNIIYMFY